MSNDFLSLAGEQLVVVRRLVERLDDDQLSTQLQFMWFEWERRQWEAALMTEAMKPEPENSSRTKPDQNNQEEPDRRSRKEQERCRERM